MFPASKPFEAPVAAQKAPAGSRTRPEAARILTSFVAPTEVPEGIAEETGAFLDVDRGVEGFPIGFDVGFPSSGTAREHRRAEHTTNAARAGSRQQRDGSAKAAP